MADKKRPKVTMTLAQAPADATPEELRAWAEKVLIAFQAGIARRDGDGDEEDSDE